jgi:FlaA1/EpsC-like NDP-sugar epimerase
VAIIEAIANMWEPKPEHGPDAAKEAGLSITDTKRKVNGSKHGFPGGAVSSSAGLASPFRFRRFSVSIGRQFISHLTSGDLPRLGRRFSLAALAACLLVACRWLAYELRFDFDVPAEYQTQLYGYQLGVTCLELAWLVLFRQFSGIYRYFSLEEARYLAYAMALSGISLYAVRYFDIGFTPPKGVILIQCLLSFIALGGVRVAWRLGYERFGANRRNGSSSHRKVAIIGAGDVGASLVRELHARPNLGLLPVAFLDDDRRKWGSRIHGVPVVGGPERVERYKAKFRLDEVIFAMPSATPRRVSEIVGLLHEAHLKHVTVPSIDQLTSGAVRLTQFRAVKIEDLLGREIIDLKVDQIGNVLTDRVVMVTGAGGSIGSELCRQVARFHPRRLLLLDQSEVQLFQIEQELVHLGQEAVVTPLIADILDEARLNAIFACHKPAVVFHAAAHKHVGMMEIQPGEAIKNNAFGTALLAELSALHKVERFVMISTDKAVNPTSVMGASKRLAEVFLEAFAEAHGGRTRFVAVRFGNVLGSSGSVVPIFEKQIAEGGPVTVTHPDVVRYFMTIPEAVGLVLQSCALGMGGEIFVLDMGKPVKIAELARQMVKLSGLEPGRDIDIKFIGLRPGEKLYEELQHLRANCTDTAHPRLKRLTSQPAPLGRVRAQMNWLKQALHDGSPDELKAMLQQILPEYRPHLETQKDGLPLNGHKETTRHVKPRAPTPEPAGFTGLTPSFGMDNA